jgi:single-stranded-DNA-specific exonuclease
MKKSWQVFPKAPQDFFEQQKDYSPIVSQLLFNRGLLKKNEIEYFLHPDSQIKDFDPFLFKDMEPAINLVITHIKNGSSIVVCGDYDADGVTSSALLVEILKTLKANVEVWIPSRFGEGYGLNKKIVQELKNKNVSLIITVDNGVRAKEEIILAQSLGIDVIVTDHHEGPAAETDLPPCLIINPILKRDSYPFKYLCGAGVAYKFALALISRSTLPDSEKQILENRLVDLAAIGTISDCVSLLGENRLIVSEGLKLINKQPRRGLKELLEIAMVNSDDINSWNISWQITPRLNAAGRIDHANTAYALFMSKSADEAHQLAQDLNDKNIERQKMTTEIMQSGIELVEAEQMNEKLLVVLSPDLRQSSHSPTEITKEWPEGIIGLVAGRIAERFSKPCFVICKSEGKIKGSGRSVEALDLGGSLEIGKDHLERFGGHKMACGFTVKSVEDLGLFIQKIRAEVDTQLVGKDLSPILKIDAEISLNNINMELLEDLEKFRPYGQDNAEPTFVSFDIPVEDIVLMGQDKKHIKFRFNNMWAVAFSKAEELKEIIIGQRVNIVYTISLNVFNNRSDLQLKIVDMRINT